MSIFAEIIRAGKASGKSVPEVNEELKAAGATFSLNPDHTESGWTEDEMVEDTCRVTWDEAGRPVKAVRLHG